MKDDIHEQHKWSPKNTNVLDVDDWEVTFIGGLAGSGACGLFFGFRSINLRQYLKFSFVGGGLGLGIMGSWNDPQDVEFDCSRADWRRMKPSIPEPFSSSNLTNANGRVSLYSFGTPGKIGFGYTRFIVTAVYDGPLRQGMLFDKFEFGGTGFGTGGVSAGVHLGRWVFLGLPSGSQMNNNWTKPLCK